MSLRNRFGVFCFALIFVTAYTYAFADPKTTDSACLTPDARPPVVERFSIVHLTALNAIKSTIAPHLGGDVLEALFLRNGDPNPDTQVNNRITYERKGIEKGIQFTNKLFLVRGVLGPGGGVEDAEPFAFIKVRVDEVDTLCRSDTGPPDKVRNLGRWVSVLLKGTIMDGVAVFGNPIGDDYTFSFAYTVDPGDDSQFLLCADGTLVSEHPFRDLNSVDPGRASDYRDCADIPEGGSIAFRVHP